MQAQARGMSDEGRLNIALRRLCEHALYRLAEAEADGRATPPPANDVKAAIEQRRASGESGLTVAEEDRVPTPGTGSELLASA